MAARFCKCGVVTTSNACERCSKHKRCVEHKTTKQRGYGADWKALSERYRKQYPLCEDCLKAGRVRPSREVHHIIPIAVDETLRMEWTNLVALCGPCHDARHDSKTQHC